MGNDVHLATYVDEDFEQEVRDLAEMNDVSVSRFIHDTLEKRVRQDRFEEANRKHNAELRIEDLVSQARDEVSEGVSDSKALQSFGAVYSIAMWELVKEPFSEVERKNAIRTATHRINDDLEDLGLNPEKIKRELSTIEHEENEPETDPSLETDSDTADTSTATSGGDDEGDDEDTGWSY